MSARLRAWFRNVPLVPAHATATDGELVERFVDVRDEAAFGELMHRHGPMVLATCRRVLYPDVHTAEDAFQATFLVLATKAATVSPPGRVGAWLHGVAFHVARKARDRARKLAPAADLDRVAARHTAPDPDLGELRARIDDVLAGLPAKYRAAVVLCDLEQLPRAEAARALGWTEGALSGRLARARKLLADRLARRGVALPAAGLAAILPVADVPAQLAASTLHTAALIATGVAAGETAPASVIELARSVPTHAARFKLLAAGIAGVAVALGCGFYALAAPERPAPPPLPVTPVALPAAPAEARAPVPAGIGKRWAVKYEFGCPGPVATVAFGPTVVAVGDEKGRLFVWDSATGARKGAVNLSTWKFEPLGRVQVFPDGTVRAVTGNSEDPGAAYYLDFRPPFDRDKMSATHTNTPFGGTADGLYSLVYDNDGRDVSLWDNDPDAGKKGGATRQASFRHDDRVAHAAGDTGTAVATVTNVPELRLWSKDAAEPLWTVKFNDKVADIEITSVCVSAGGKLVAVTGAPGQARVFDGKTGRAVSRTPKLPGKIWSAALAPDGKALVAGCDDGLARVYDTQTGEEIAVLKSHTEAVRSVAFSPDGKLIATGSADKNAKVWEFQK